MTDVRIPDHRGQEDEVPRLPRRRRRRWAAAGERVPLGNSSCAIDSLHSSSREYILTYFDGKQTRESEQPAAPRDPYYIADAARFRGQQQRGGAGALPVNENANSAFGAHNGIVFNEDLRRSLARMERLMQSEQKVSAARRRREGHLSVREAACRASNLKHAQASRAALQRKWADDADRERKAFALKTSSAEQVLLSKVKFADLRSSARSALTL